MIDSFAKDKEIFKNLKYYIENKSKYNPTVASSFLNNKYPLVIFERIKNSSGIKTTNYINVSRNISYTVNCFARDINDISSSQICEELAQLVNEVMQDYYGMDGGVTTEISKFDGTPLTHQTVLTYEISNIPKYNIIY